MILNNYKEEYLLMKYINTLIPLIYFSSRKLEFIHEFPISQ